ncbi:MAG: xanthine dehydrogenase family protein subunit M [Pseudomonadota bacterium]
MTFEYHKPPTLPEALALIAAESTRFPILAGGTDIVAQWRIGAISPKGLIDISNLQELEAITITESHVEIGALVAHSRIVANEKIAQIFPALACACQSVGCAQIQNMGTIGGNIMNASPAADVPPVLMVYDTKLLAQNLKGERWVSADDFFKEYKKTALEPDELLTKIRIKIPDPSEQTRFYKIGARRAQTISKVCMCARALISHGGIEWAKIAVGSVAPTVVRTLGTEALLKGKAITTGLLEKARKSLADEVKPIDDIRSNADYRRFAAGGLLVRYLREATKSSASL